MATFSENVNEYIGGAIHVPYTVYTYFVYHTPCYLPILSCWIFSRTREQTKNRSEFVWSELFLAAYGLVASKVIISQDVTANHVPLNTVLRLFVDIVLT